jgi:NodT family efflux transporter outer membrane factor (OMF) lipoprotein
MRVREARARAPVFVVFFISACSVGPDFQRPDAMHNGTFVEATLPMSTVAGTDASAPAQNLRVGNDLAQDWWTLYRSEALNQFIVSALRENATLAGASAALRQAQENLAASRGSLLFPSVNASAGAARERASGAQLGLNSPGSAFSLYNAGVNVSYTFDLFGSVRRQLEAAQAQVDYQENQYRATQLALTANIVTSVIREAQLREQVQALRAVEKLQRDGLVIVERRFNLGAVTKTDVLSQRTALAQTVAAISPLERQRAQTRHQLAVYAGKAPSELDLAAFDVAHLELPVDLPVSVASDLVRQRPDILASESLLHAASAQVGVATANLYPQITLGGNYGVESLTPGSLFKSSSVVWGLTGSVTQPIFHGGALLAQRRAAIAAFDQAAAAYRQTVLTAFQNVADALRALEFDAQTLVAQADAYDQAKAAADLAQRQFDTGASSYLSLLSAQQQYQQTAVNLVQARADRLADTAALFQALGGGWWNPPQSPPAAKPVASSN